MALTPKRKKKLDEIKEAIKIDIIESSSEDEKHTDRIQVRLPPSVKKQLKMVVVDKDTTISALIYPLILNLINEAD